MVLLVVIGCGGPHSNHVLPDEVSQPRSAIERTAAVYDVVLGWHREQLRDGQIVLDARAMDLPRNHDDYLRRSFSDLSQSATEAFIGVYREPALHTNPLGIRTEHALLTPEARAAITASGELAWDSFHAQYPRSQGLLTLSKVGFSTDERYALVYLGRVTGGIGEGNYFMVERDGQEWQIVRIVEAWVA